MRDAHLLKEKVQVSLDNRQVASLVVSCLVILGLTFGIGVVVGRKLAPPPATEVPRDVLAEVDQKAKEPAFDPAKELTYRQELTKAVEPSSKPAPKVEAVRAPETPARAAAPAKPAVEEKQASEQPAAAKTDDPGAEETPETTTANAAIGGAFDRARLLPDKPKSASPVPAGAFAIQVSASQDKTEADGVVQKLRSVGYAPYVVDVTLPGKGRWYRVRLGHFGGKAEAEKYLKDFKRETRLDAIVTASR
jgi:DedD protein